MADDRNKLMFPDINVGKRDLIGYYADIADVMTRHLFDRCLTLQRFPDGIESDGFYQQRYAGHFADSVECRSVPNAEGTESIEHIVLRSRDGLEYLADQATIAFHGWLSRVDRPDHPDKLIFDLDPAGSGGDFGLLVDCARDLKSALEAREMRSFVMTTGSRGLHVAAPLDGHAPFDDVRAFARQIAAAVVEKSPQRYTIEQRKKARAGRLYIDTTRNAYGQTAVIPYSLRALPGAPVAAPLDWEELGRKGMGPQRYRFDNIRRRLAQKQDPWRDFFRQATRIRR